jgi:hypothetical protein
MKVTSTALAILSAASATYAFVPRPLTPVLKNANARSTQQLYALGVKEKEETTTATTGSTVNGSVEQADSTDPDAEGLPWWWEYLFKLPALQPAPQGTDCTFADSATNVLRTNINIEQIYGGFPSLDKCPLGEGEITDIADGTMFIGLQRYQQQ